ncbi:MAG: DUF5681 domain-containing protein [Candidatus Halichondribacter symbioticus]
MDNPKIPHLADYDTGYKKPPKTSQFKKGTSGNPSGRPKGALNKLPKHELRLQDLLVNEAYRDVTIKEGSNQIKLPVMQAVLRSIMLNAAQGKVPAQRLLLDNLTRIEDKQNKDKLEFFGEMVAYKFKAKKMIADAKEKGVTLEHEFIPHPDHIVLDSKTGDVKFTGPFDENNKDFWDKMWMHKKNREIDIKYFKKTLAEGKDNEWAERSLASEQHLLEMIEQIILTTWHLPVHDVVNDPFRWTETLKRIESGELPREPKKVKVKKRTT